MNRRICRRSAKCKLRIKQSLISFRNLIEEYGVQTIIYILHNPQILNETRELKLLMKSFFYKFLNIIEPTNKQTFFYKDAVLFWTNIRTFICPSSKKVELKWYVNKEFDWSTWSISNLRCISQPLIFCTSFVIERLLFCMCVTVTLSEMVLSKCKTEP